MQRAVPGASNEFETGPQKTEFFFGPYIASCDPTLLASHTNFLTLSCFSYGLATYCEIRYHNARPVRTASYYKETVKDGVATPITCAEVLRRLRAPATFQASDAKDPVPREDPWLGKPGTGYAEDKTGEEVTDYSVIIILGLSLVGALGLGYFLAAHFSRVYNRMGAKYDEAWRVLGSIRQSFGEALQGEPEGLQGAHPGRTTAIHKVQLGRSKVHFGRVVPEDDRYSILRTCLRIKSYHK